MKSNEMIVAATIFSPPGAVVAEWLSLSGYQGRQCLALRVDIANAQHVASALRELAGEIDHALGVLEDRKSG